MNAFSYIYQLILRIVVMDFVLWTPCTMETSWLIRTISQRFLENCLLVYIYKPYNLSCICYTVCPCFYGHMHLKNKDLQIPVELCAFLCRLRWS